MKHTLLLSLGLLLGSLPGYAQFTRTYAGSILATDPAIPGDRILRDGTTAACTSTKVFPGTITGTGVHYDTYAVANTSTTATNCVTITLAPTCTETTAVLFVSVYTNTFVATNQATNYKSDMGSSPAIGATGTMAVTLAPSEVITIVVSTTAAATTCSAYSLTVAAPIALPTKASQDIEVAALRAYPNPVADVLHIEAAKAGTYALYNLTGQLVREIKGTNPSLADLPGGVYLLRQAETGTTTRITKL